MSSFRQIRRRIKSVENTKKMTHAMEMVAAAKLKKLQDLLKQSDIYIGELRRILGALVQEKPLAHPLLEKRAETKNTLTFLIASDTGLCGSYNTNLMERANRFRSATTEPIHFISVGKQAFNFLKRNRLKAVKEFNVPRPQEIDKATQEITNLAIAEFQRGTADRVVFIYTKVFSLGSLRPTAEQLFPFATAPSSSPHPNLPPQRGEGITVDYIIEPSLEDILNVIIPEFIQAQVGQFVKHSLVAEQVSRMMAMRQATDNAKEMIESLTLARNKARQALITKELIEVVSGSRALHMK